MRALYFLVRSEYPVSKSFVNGIIVFQINTTFLQDLHIVWYKVLMFTNRLSGIQVFENRTGQDFFPILTISDV